MKTKKNIKREKCSSIKKEELIKELKYLRCHPNAGYANQCAIDLLMNYIGDKEIRHSFLGLFG